MITSDHVQDYLRALSGERSEVMAEMEALAERDGIPIVHWETGRLLAVLVAALPVRLGDLGVERDDAFETGGNLEQLRHSASFRQVGAEG